jgi:UDP-glucuronate decarboxylase
MKTALVAGGAGFLGSHLCDRLLSEGRKVVCLDDLSTGSQANIAHLSGNADFDFIEADVLAPVKIAADEIYNLACPASPRRYQADPVRTMKINVIGTLNLLELAKSNGAIFFQASTSEVYGDPAVHPQPESYLGNVNPIGIRACYDEGKRCAETLCFDFNRSHGVKIKVVRIFNTYGPRMRPDDGRVVSNFIVQALRNHDITIYGAGSQTRSFCYADDMIDGFWRLMNAPDPVTGPVNIGNTSEFTMFELASKIISLTGSKSKLAHMPLPLDDPMQRQPDISLAESALGWRPEVSLEAGLVRTIDYFAALQAVKSN